MSTRKDIITQAIVSALTAGWSKEKTAGWLVNTYKMTLGEAYLRIDAEIQRRGQTHYYGCWRAVSHHECAVKLIERAVELLSYTVRDDEMANLWLRDAGNEQLLMEEK